MPRFNVPTSDYNDDCSMKAKGANCVRDGTPHGPVPSIAVTAKAENQVDDKD